MQDNQELKNYSIQSRVLTEVLPATTTWTSARVSFPKSNGLLRNKRASKPTGALLLSFMGLTLKLLLCSPRCPSFLDPYYLPE